MTNKQNLFTFSLLSLVTVFGVTTRLCAQITVTGDTVPIPGDSAWSLGGSSSFDATIGNTGTGTGTVAGGSSLQTNTLDVGDAAGGNGSLTVTGSGSTVSAEGPFYVGRDGTGEVSVLSGGLVNLTGAIVLGRFSGSSGTAIVSGSGSLLTAGSSMVLAREGTGVFTVSSGGMISAVDRIIVGNDSGGSGSLLVTGSGSSAQSTGIFYIGRSGGGTLSIENGGSVSSAEDVKVSDETGSTGSISFDSGTLSAGGALFANASDLSGTGSVTAKGLVGEGYQLNFDNSNNAQTTVTNGGSDSITVDITADGSGALGADMIVQNGATVSSTSAFLGYEAGETSDITVTGTGSSWTNSGLDFEVGTGGSGNLRVENGATVSARSIYVARDFGSSGSLTISGTNSLVEGTGVAIGNNGTGSLRIENGGRLEAIALVLLPQHGVGSGTLTLDGGTVELTSFFEADASAISGDGTINATGLVGNGYSLLFDGSSAATTSVDGGGVTLNITTSSNSRLGTNMEMRNGAVINGYQGWLGDRGGNHKVLVTGSGTEWNNSSILQIGGPGKARLRVQKGGVVTADDRIVVGEGRVDIVGPGSRLEGAHYLDISGTGVVTVAGSGTVRIADEITVDSGGQVNLVITGDNTIEAGSSGIGDFENNGTVRLVAGPNLAAGTYTPIVVGSTSGSITGTGQFDAYGGIWNAGAASFSASEQIDGSGGIMAVNLSGERASFDGGNLSAAFAADAGTGSFDASALSIASIGDDPVLAAYTFTTDVASAFLSFDIGGGQIAESLSVYHRADSSSPWSKVSPDSFSYDGQRAHFLAETFSEYALAVPEPSTFILALFAALILGLKIRRHNSNDIRKGVSPQKTDFLSAQEKSSRFRIPCLHGSQRQYGWKVTSNMGFLFSHQSTDPHPGCREFLLTNNKPRNTRKTRNEEKGAEGKSNG